MFRYTVHYQQQPIKEILLSVHTKYIFLICLFPVQLEYVSDFSQLEFLQLLSDRARQQITYHCKNSVAWPDGSSDDAAKSIKMLTINGLELHAKSSNKFKPKLLGDDCKVRAYVQ